MTLADGHEDVARLSAAARALWAKSGGGLEDENGLRPWLCLPQHMLDSACAAQWLWQHWVSDLTRHRLAELVGLEETETGTLFIWLAAVHDLGKATVTFQTQLERRGDHGEFTRRLRDAGLPLAPPVWELNLPRFPHAMASGLIVESWLEDQDMPARAARRLAQVADCHHGVVSPQNLREPAAVALRNYPESWKALHRELLDFAADISRARPLLRSYRQRITAPTQTLLTGLVIMADWMASNTDAFPLGPVLPQGERVENAMDVLDLTEPWRPPAPDPAAVDDHLARHFAWPADRTARPIQRAVSEICHELQGPGLLLIEAPTGEGKTEAALLAAEVLAARFGSGGVMVAAPTMATADGLFQRVLAWAERSSGPVPTSMFLGHSKNSLNRDFRALRSQVLNFRSVEDDGDASRDAGGVIASSWMSGRKKGILSTFTVATVDQVLFMALQAKHSMLRHVGLAGKVVIIDECHAYDTYMSAYLQTALEWLAHYRVPVILLSATLPAELKRSLLGAYRGASVREPLSAAYPLITAVDRETVVEHPVEARCSDLHAQLTVIGDGLEELMDRLDSLMGDGGCVLIICNAVARAQSVYRELVRTHPGEAELHHAAFVASDRAKKEERLRGALGPETHRGAGRPHRRFIVATQVAEQSLDIDVDLLVTDLAPMDLLIQRIGRLHRHVRPDSDRPVALRQARVLIRGLVRIEPPEFVPSAAAVYDERLLLSTLAVLENGPLRDGLVRPDDVSPVVQAAYSTDPPIPPSWADLWESATTESERARMLQEGRARTFRFPQIADASDLDRLFTTQSADVDTAQGEAGGMAQVRDTDPSIEVIPIRTTDTGYRHVHSPVDSTELLPDATPSREASWSFATSTVRLPVRLTRNPARFEELLSRLERETPAGWAQDPLLRGQLALCLTEDGTVLVGQRTLAYDSDLGLVDLTDP